MSCTVFSNDFEIIFDKSDSKSNGYTLSGQRATNYRSALQNPDMNRLNLAAILRKKDGLHHSKEQKHFWHNFQSNQIQAHANANE